MSTTIISLLIFGPLFLYPFSFCPFRLPYLYCFICPVRCAWYRARGIVLLVVLGLNIKKGLFCSQICPFGTIQVLLSKISPNKINSPRFLRSLKYLSLIVIASVVVATKAQQALFVIRWRGLLWGIFLLSMLLSIFNYRFFCNNLCPIKVFNRRKMG